MQFLTFYFRDLPCNGLKTYYPDDILSLSTLLGSDLLVSQKAAIDSLNEDNQHRIFIPVQVETYLDKNDNSIADSDELMSLQRTNFKESSGFIVPETIQTLKGEYHSTNNPLQERIEYHDYYSSGNVKEVSKTNGTHVVYIWGYNKQYPIAKIENASYSQLSSQVANLQSKSDADNDRTIGSSGNEGLLRTSLENLRNSLVNAMVTTYTYDPLIGVTSITDPKGQTIYYQYDDFGRLEFVKDQDGNILSKNQYHYKN